MTLALVPPRGDLKAELRELEYRTKFALLMPEDAARIVDCLMELGARKTVQGRYWLMWMGHVEEWGGK